MKQVTPETNCLNRSLAYLSQFWQGNFAAFFHDLDEEEGHPIPKDTFAAQWGQLIQAFGPQQQVLHTSVVQENGFTSVEITTLHILRKLIITFLYTADGAVRRCSFQMAPLDVAPQTSELWEEHAVQIGQLEKKLNGLLTLPKGEAKPPVVLLLQGSGPSNMNEQVGMGGNMPFADLAHGLAELGVASLRYDKRSYAYPEDAAYAGVEVEYLDDAGEAVQSLRRDQRVDGDKIYLLGHSEGGMIGPEVLRRNPEIKGFISLAGTLRRLEDLMLEQVKKILADADTLSEEQKRTQREAMEQAVGQIKSLEGQEDASIIAGASVKYWRSLHRIAPPALVRQLDIPMLILQGGEDFQVLADVDYPLWQDALSGNPNASFRLYPGLNHLFMTGGSKDHIDISVYNTLGHVDKQVISEIAAWVKSNP